MSEVRRGAVMLYIRRQFATCYTAFSTLWYVIGQVMVHWTSEAWVSQRRETNVMRIQSLKPACKLLHLFSQSLVYAGNEDLAKIIIEQKTACWTVQHYTVGSMQSFLELHSVALFCFCSIKSALLVLWYVAEIVHAKVGERVWLTWLSDEFPENFRIAEVDRCIAGSREARENDKAPVGMSRCNSLLCKTWKRW